MEEKRKRKEKEGMRNDARNEKGEKCRRKKAGLRIRIRSDPECFPECIIIPDPTNIKTKF